MQREREREEWMMNEKAMGAKSQRMNVNRRRVLPRDVEVKKVSGMMSKGEFYF